MPPHRAKVLLLGLVGTGIFAQREVCGEPPRCPLESLFHSSGWGYNPYFILLGAVSWEQLPFMSCLYTCAQNTSLSAGTAVERRGATYFFPDGDVYRQPRSRSWGCPSSMYMPARTYSRSIIARYMLQISHFFSIPGLYSPPPPRPPLAEAFTPTMAR